MEAKAFFQKTMSNHTKKKTRLIMMQGSLLQILSQKRAFSY